MQITVTMNLLWELTNVLTASAGLKDQLQALERRAIGKQFCAFLEVRAVPTAGFAFGKFGVQGRQICLNQIWQNACCAHVLIARTVVWVVAGRVEGSQIHAPTKVS